MGMESFSNNTEPQERQMPGPEMEPVAEGSKPTLHQEELKDLEQPADLQVAESTFVIESSENTLDKPKSSIEVTGSLKRKGLDFTDSLRVVNGKIGRVNEDIDVVSQKAVGGFKVAARNLEDIFSSKEINLDDAALSFGRLTSSFDELSSIQDGELRKVPEDARKALLYAINGSMDSAIMLKGDASMEQLRKKINNMLSKAEEAAHRLRRGVRS